VGRSVEQLRVHIVTASWPVDPVHPAQSSLANTQAGIVDPQSHSVSQVELPKRLPIMAY
jgi:hypothetical protein